MPIWHRHDNALTTVALPPATDRNCNTKDYGSGRSWAKMDFRQGLSVTSYLPIKVTRCCNCSGIAVYGQ